MGTTFAKLLDDLVSFRYMKFRDDPERAAERINMLEHTIQAILEKLRDQLDPD